MPAPKSGENQLHKYFFVIPKVSGQFKTCPSLNMTGNSRTADFGLLMNFTGMITVVFAVPCAGLSFSSLGHQAGLLKSRKK